MRKESAGPNKLILLPGIIIVILQWLFFGRAARIERWGAIVLIIIVMYGTSLLLDKSIATANMGLMFIIFSIPVISLSFVIWAVVTRNLSTVSRRISLIIFILLASGSWTLLRTNGMTGDGRHNLGWRWAETKEEMLLTHDGNDAVLSLSGIVAADTISEWPGFRGANRDVLAGNVLVVRNHEEMAAYRLDIKKSTD